MKVLITGGSRGIGRAIVALFIEKGHDVYSPTREELDLAKDFKLIRCDFDIVINNGGINPLKNIEQINDREVMQVNYQAPLSIVQQCIPYMVAKGYGRIINIGSIWIGLSMPNRLAYSASKNAVHALTKSIVAEYGGEGILANTISPGFIATDLTYQNNSESQIQQIKDKVPLKRLGTPQEVAKLVYQLTVENSFIAGQNIIIDGGYSCTAH
ncbi:FabG Dehydrogenases with different specificities (related to short-chain alcohol dehydrogenases) [uncultured Caudovirales phage]|uniref:FabG Dehydrogenases with different specificities (Related to short-chain alcohol dehydrogenases) n=1 Tax=uncultured Caudovirales phage TaxID=2100421 RepID=A0A6J5KX27_9CAUD|nr:FabG Dehydrogenases with different specificities (related to short-chain alcohol dehydrogenases) [uncultured Caudovirales phage]